MLIVAISGRVIRVLDESTTDNEKGVIDPKKGTEYTIASKADITLDMNGTPRKVQLSELSNGDEVEITNGTKEGYKRVVAVRPKPDEKKAKNPPLKSVPQPSQASAVLPEKEVEENDKQTKKAKKH